MVVFVVVFVVVVVVVVAVVVVVLVVLVGWLLWLLVVVDAGTILSSIPQADSVSYHLLSVIYTHAGVGCGGNNYV